MADINADGNDDLCGLWGPVSQTTTVNGVSRTNPAFVFGCVLNQGNGRFGGPFLQAHFFNSPRNASIHTTIRAIDVNGDGRLDLCGRIAAGIACHFSSATSPTGFSGQSVLQTSFSDANGWSLPQHFSTIDFARLDGTLHVCGRGRDGVLCFPKLTSRFGSQAHLQSTFSDSDGWALPQHYSTLRYVDVNGDGHTDICGRGNAGIVCSLWRPSPARSFGPAQTWTTQYRDSDGWADPKYYTSIRFGDINRIGNFADVCGRGSGGLHCGASNGTSFLWATSSPQQQEMRDGTGWDITSQLPSLQIVDFDGDGKNDVCGLQLKAGERQPDLMCAKSNSTSTSIAFTSLVTRVDKVTVVQGRVVSGRLFVSGTRVGFCWLGVSDVNCSNQWQ